MKEGDIVKIKVYPYCEGRLLYIKDGKFEKEAFIKCRKPHGLVVTSPNNIRKA